MGDFGTSRRANERNCKNRAIGPNALHYIAMQNKVQHFKWRKEEVYEISSAF
jgi:hypothetical protein